MTIDSIAKWNSALLDFIIYSRAFPTVRHVRMSSVDKAYDVLEVTLSAPYNLFSVPLLVNLYGSG